MRSAPPRRWEIDGLRGLAVVLMVISNFMFDLIFFAGQGQLQSEAWDWFARCIAGFFIVLAGVSLTLSRCRAASPAAIFGKNLRRGLTLLACGGLISGATWLVAGEQMVLFGVLHLIGLGVIISYPFLGRPRTSLAGGLLLLALGPLTHSWSLGVPWFLWLGLQPANYSSVDYVPLIPWFGPMLIGVFLGHRLYSNGQPRWPLTDGSASRFLQPLVWCGRRSLSIYLGHQPVLLAGIITFQRWGLSHVTG